ncbi:MAG: ABC transporter ATP-binding protein [Piscirickettsiaceae bacterium CG_4_10_14_3_um_filter_44_349]|nr:ABC transporter ATP-binding protein [Thiomicrospira sp.]OIP94337.1 MAG: ABC transporter ATP-binding protein [Thiomicrospira sp. CG2_30_44_34]PIQ02581.1 MAG: ABC transporter ATP-binding protein [Piscirickettsiaceae bacterium CG18_big_fil_WC_8_21_14_2_50_44_103]PIU39552.1 MAG: ABC transporter ATP-binding protein [Piscirickettsiaceae bacterium CG07_land_8_20_14_0_80_44_28]PIW57579.1 MAG: ABC transporter ATP-binding protein [Piscirickettsiaceae bacterium CG12_big_fil_rev_8_21_14_0_65_44_934]PIW
MAQAIPILSVQQLQIEVNGMPLVKNINFEIQAGEIFALVGESGSGKSLTALAIMRLLPENLEVRSGQIHLNQQSIFGLPEHQMQRVRGKQVAMIFQEPMTSLNPVMTVGEQVAEVLRVHLRMKSTAARNKVISLFEEVGIPEASARYDWYPHQLSGGQKQRVMIAMALACEPDLLIADEPTTALDVTIQAQVLALLKKIRQDRGLSILFITHDMGVVNEMADRVAVMQKGELVEQADKAHFFENASHPYTRQLLADAVPSHLFKPAVQTEILLEIDALKVHFPIKKGLFQRTIGQVKAVDGVSLTIAKGETLALVGESGSGKSTIGQAILKLVEATSGSVALLQSTERVNVLDLSEREMKPYRKQLQVIFQDPYSALNPRMQIREILLEGMKSLKVGENDQAWQEQRIDELLQQVGLLPEHKYRYPHEFSGGQRQRIGIARALAVEPKLIICDEPTSALDVSVRAQVLALLNQLQQQYQMSYLFITHDLSIISAIAHQVAVMKQGQIVETGSVEAVMCQPQHPYTQALLNSAPSLIRQSLSS